MFEKIIGKIKKFFKRNKSSEFSNENDEVNSKVNIKDNDTLSKVSGGQLFQPKSPPDSRKEPKRR